jgi:hypothetical protein
MKGSLCLCSQITGGVENVVPVHVDIPGNGGRGSDLPLEAVKQEYLQFPYEYVLLLLLSVVTVVIFVLQTTAEEKITRIKIG